ncbi:MAG: hypothetical protein PHH83_03595 [Patescibacteria group bacterium]|nr:hypothetical protein [Patescibacteria group bacterium]
MKKKIIILSLLSILFVGVFLLALYLKANLAKNHKQIVIEQDNTEKHLDVMGLVLKVEQNKQEILLNFYTNERYLCGDLNYIFNVDKEKSIINLELENITEKIICEKNPRIIEKREMIGSIKNRDLNIYYKNKILKYKMVVDNNNLQIFNIENTEDQNIVKFESNNYLLLANNILRLRIDYYDKRAEQGVNNLLKRLEFSKKEVKIDDTQIAFSNLTSISYKTNAPYSVVKYLTFDDENLLKTIVLEFKTIDCYKDNADHNNCISLDFRTSTGKRYCTWLNAIY